MADEFFSAAMLRDMCISSSDIDYGYCAGYVTGIAHIMQKSEPGGFRACRLAEVRSQQLVDTFSLWAEIFPNQLGIEAETAVAAALARAFPCPNTAE